ncbi:MAG TPA: sugar phosphate nucleotidyltransferase [bacterium]|nr:sugar phosphate nucleotidyltransferase [bacterium]HPS29974.1 sugar phosphate nucleotidyltransferase [bacterium]
MKYAIIPSAGLATRFLPASKCVPKELFPVLDKPAVQYVVEEAVSAGMNSVVFVSGAGKESILDHFDTINPKFFAGELNTDIRNKVDNLDLMIDVVSIRQKKPLGLGHAVLKGAELVNGEAFSVLLPDMLILPKYPQNSESSMCQMADLHKKTGKSVIALMHVPDELRNKYGIVEGIQIEKNIFKITKMLEKPGISETSSNLAIVGRYIFTSAIIDIIKQTLPGKGGEIQLTDAIVKLSSIDDVFGLVIDDLSLIFDTGSIEGLIMANSYLAASTFPGFKKSLLELLEKHS